MITINIDGKDIGADEGSTILEAATRVGIKIPTLCYHEAVSPLGVCRLCSVEVTTTDKTRIIQSCLCKVKPGLIVKTDTPEVIALRKKILKQIFRDALSEEEIERYSKSNSLKGLKFPAGNSVCRFCGLCIRICKEIAEANVLKFEGKGEEKHIVPVSADGCIGCGGCSYLCPNGNITIDGEYIKLQDTRLGKLNELQRKDE